MKLPSLMLSCALVLAGLGCNKDTPAQASSSVIEPGAATETAPARYQARFDTSKGAFVVEVQREWAPLGADRFFNLVKGGFYDEVRFFRVVPGFMAQFGIHGDPAVMSAWRGARIGDDPPQQSNTRGMLSFAMAGPSSRTTQVFINLVDNTNLDSMGFAPFAKVVDGMQVVDALYGGYGDGAPSGNGPSQGRLQSEGNAYLAREFDQLDYVKKASILP